MKLRALIVDDEPVARQVLREELDGIPGVEIIAEADNGISALNQITTEKPDLVLLDLQMPEMGGFEVIQEIRLCEYLPVIIIVTAYDKFALDAFDAGAIDYLLKPVSQDRLAAAVDKARRITGNGAVQRLAQLQEIAEPVASGRRPRKIVGKLGAEFFLLGTDEIYAFQADGDIVWITTARKRYMATQTLRALEERLRNTSFQRIHRNALVNVDHVRKMSVLSSQRWLITLGNDQEFVASKRQAGGIKALLNW